MIVPPARKPSATAIRKRTRPNTVAVETRAGAPAYAKPVDEWVSEGTVSPC
jgi:hypothetical protein